MRALLPGTPDTASFVEEFNRVNGTLAGNGLPWLDSLRRSGIEMFEALGFPSTHNEPWKYTGLWSLGDTVFKAVNGDDGKATVDLVPSLLPMSSGHPRIVFVNGRMRPDLSRLDALPEGVTVQSLGEAMVSDPDWVGAYLGRIGRGDGQSLMALNTAMMDSGTVIRVRKGVIVEQPIEIVYIAGLTDAPVAYHPRSLMILEPNSQATVVKHHAGLGVGAYFANAVSEIDIADGATLCHYRVQSENIEATHLASVHVRVGRNSTYDGFGLSVGGRVSRTEVHVRLEGQGGHCNVNGAYLMKGREHCDNTSVIEHIAPNTSSREVFKGVLNDQSRGVFQGRIIVHKGAQKTDGYQLSKALLLADGAEMDAKPELEIYADDVKCSHGATTGQLDEAALFYLRSRGIPEALAQNILVQSFLAEAIDEITDADLKQAMMDRVIHWLPAHCFLSDGWTGG